MYIYLYAVEQCGHNPRENNGGRKRRLINELLVGSTCVYTEQAMVAPVNCDHEGLP